METTLRTFVAVELPEQVLAALGQAQAGLSARATRAGVGRSVRWVSPSGIHLTLKFLGDTPASLVPEIQSRLAAGLSGQRRLAVSLSGLGVFPSLRAPRVLWVGLAGDLAGLAELQRRVEDAIGPLGYPADSRPFSPHLTLARVGEAASPSDRQVLGEIVRSYSPAPVGQIEVGDVSLMRSELSRAGPRYTRLLAVGLG